MLEAMVETRTKEAIHLTNGISVEVHTASFRTVRGYTVCAVLLDEIAFWDSDEGAANPDAEIVNALRPAMATVDGALLVGLSSPYARRGELWRQYERHFGVEDSDVLVWQADTRTMNPTVPQSLIDRALAEDEPVARAEYFAEWRRDIEQFVSREVLDAVTVPDRRELPPAASVQYVAFVDPSGGAADSMTLAIAHRAGKLNNARLFHWEPAVRPVTVAIPCFGNRNPSAVLSVNMHRALWPQTGTINVSCLASNVS